MQRSGHARGIAMCRGACNCCRILIEIPGRRGIASVLKLRLRRMGAKRQPSYRIVVAESSSPRDGRFIETIGIYNPKTQPMTLRVDNERAKYWLDRGAQPTDTVRSLLVRTGVVEGRISKEGLAEGYVTEVPRRGVAPEVMPAHGGPAE
jgi:small subunit ribosomal protein S16